MRLTKNLSVLVRLIQVATLATCVGRAQKTDFTAQVLGVVEGDIIRVNHGGAQQKIRLWGIDCPEMNQTYGPQAKKFTQDLTAGKTVTVQVLEIDRFKRQVAHVILPDGRDLNHEIVKAGYGWWFVRYAKDDKILEQLEAEAKAAKRGLWAQDYPAPPWEHRKDKRGPQ